MSDNNILCKKHAEQQYSVHLLRYEYIEWLRCMAQLLPLMPFTNCLLLYHIESMLCYFLIPVQEKCRLALYKDMYSFNQAKRRACFATIVTCTCVTLRAQDTHTHCYRALLPFETIEGSIKWLAFA